MEKRKCTGRNCPFQYDRIVPGECLWPEACRFATFPVSNGDRLRAMTDEELAQDLMDMISGGAGFCCKNLPECKAARDQNADWLIPEENCVVCMADWLKSPWEVADDGQSKTV